MFSSSQLKLTSDKNTTIKSPFLGDHPCSKSTNLKIIMSSLIYKFQNGWPPRNRHFVNEVDFNDLFNVYFIEFIDDHIDFLRDEVKSLTWLKCIYKLAFKELTHLFNR